MVQQIESRVLIGTSGYSYTDWVGPFYPQGTRQSEFLNYYAHEFSITELNFTYYRQPEPAMTRKMISVTGPEFLFAIKAYKSLTHEFQGVDIAKEAATFLRGIEPICAAERLGVVLLQFPYSFQYSDTNRRYLNTLCTQFGTIPLAVEFRNVNWQKDSVYQGLAQRGITMVNVDEPELPNLLKPSDIVTSPIGYVRFHGRNKENWWNGDNVSRYDYLYNDNELQEWIVRLKKMMLSTKVLMIVFNNHSKGQAIQNARRLKALLEGT